MSKKRYKADYCLLDHIHLGDCVEHHIITRKNLGPDEPWNLMPLCIKAYNEIHQIGLNSMVKRYPEVEIWLHLNGWGFDAYSNKYLHAKN